MKTQYLELQAAADAVCLEGMIRARILAAAVAVAVSAALPLPTNEVGSINSHYTLQLKHTCELQISPFNEAFVFDFQQALEYARQFWVLRYNAAFPLRRTLYAATGSFFDAVAGVPTVVSPEDLAFFTEHRHKILSLAAIARTTIILTE